MVRGIAFVCTRILRVVTPRCRGRRDVSRIEMIEILGGRVVSTIISWGGRKPGQAGNTLLPVGAIELAAVAEDRRMCSKCVYSRGEYHDWIGMLDHMDFHEYSWLEEFG